MNNVYEPVGCKVIKVIEESPTIKTIRLKPEKQFDFLAGQFVSFTVPGVGEAPFTPSSSPFEKKHIDITIMKAGKVTQAIHSLREGDIVGIRGPYGKEYPLDLYKGKDLLLVGGGVGLAPLRALFLALVGTIENYKSIMFCCGAKTPQDFIFKDQVLGEWQSLSKKLSDTDATEGSLFAGPSKETGKIGFRITVDKKDGAWKFSEGLVTKTLENLPFAPSVAIVCGPPVMMKFSTFKLLEVGFKPENIYLSMERKMYCAIGQCRHCLIGDKFVCKDGPVFTYADIKNQPNMWA